MILRLSILGILTACGSAPIDVGVTWDRLDMHREQVVADCGVGRIRSLTPLAGGSTVVCGEFGAVRLTADGDLVEQVAFDVREAHAVPIGTFGGGQLEDWTSGMPLYVDLGGGWADVNLIDGEGATIWTRPRAGEPDSASCLAAGDLDGDGEMEFVIGYNGSGGLELVELTGRTLWHRPAVNVFCAAIGDLDGDGTAELIHSSGGRGLVVRDAGGRELWTVPGHDGPFTVFEWPALAAGPLLGITDRGRRFDILTPRGNRLLSLPLPTMGHAVTLAIGHGRSLILTRTLTSTGGRSELMVYGSEGELLYHQVCASSVAAAALTETSEELLLGLGVAIWRCVPRNGRWGE